MQHESFEISFVKDGATILIASASVGNIGSDSTTCSIVVLCFTINRCCKVVPGTAGYRPLLAFNLVT
jgi:hypothetical protein